ncbi:hypothetical protein DsansV1_C05g0051811 [Dioscorea sansibarensis]
MDNEKTAFLLTRKGHATLDKTDMLLRKIKEGTFFMRIIYNAEENIEVLANA